MSVFRQYATSKPKVLSVALLPRLFNRGPLPAMLHKWDELTAQRPVTAIGGTDVHAWRYSIGPLRRRFLPYEHCARALNTHVLVDEPFMGAKADAALDCKAEAVQHDRDLLHAALRAGHCWLGYDLIAPTRGFRFDAVQVPCGQAVPHGQRPQATMGDHLPPPPVGWETAFRVRLPAAGHIRLLRGGHMVAEAQGRRLDYRSAEAGVYRVEVRRPFWGRWRGWIYSNPIYVR
jgi:hypothetical protein